MRACPERLLLLGRRGGLSRYRSTVYYLVNLCCQFASVKSNNILIVEFRFMTFGFFPRVALNLASDKQNYHLEEKVQSFSPTVLFLTDSLHVV